LATSLIVTAICFCIYYRKKNRSISKVAKGIDNSVTNPNDVSNAQLNGTNQHLRIRPYNNNGQQPDLLGDLSVE